MSSIRTLLSEKGKPMISHQGFIYTQEKSTTSKIIFRCQDRSCKARCHTNPSMDTFLSEPTPHSHPPKPECIQAIELTNQVKAQAAISDEPTSSILHSALRTFPLSPVSELPRTDMLLQTIRRQRTTPSDSSNDRFPKHLRKTDRGEDFILHEDQDLIILTTKANLSALKQSKHWFADGTFKVCPNDFYQLFTLHGLMSSTVIPLVYGLLVGKSTKDYNNFLQKVLEQDDFCPETILTDFESGTIKAVKQTLRNATHKGCLFHFGKCIWRHIQEKNLSIKYQEDENFRLNVKRLIALAFLPLSDVVTGFDLLAAEFDDDADDLLDYFEKNWIGEPRRRGAGRKKPVFEHAMWNVYDRVLADLPRSNNAVEGWHCAFAARVTIAHPTLKKLIDKIRREQSRFEIDIAQLLQGFQPKTKKACYRKLDERIRRVVQNYNSNNLLDYLKNIAAIISL